MKRLVHGVLETVETELKYAGYIAQQQRQVDRLHDAERRHIPVEFAYTDIPGLSREVREKLQRVRPDNPRSGWSNSRRDSSRGRRP